MMIDENENGLKGQHNLASRKNRDRHGKRSVALGLENGHENRPRENVHKGENLISDERDDLVFPGNDAFQFASRISLHGFTLRSNSSTQFRPKGIICVVHCIPADGFFFCILYPGRRFGSFLPKLCSGL
jgi:hypothetical protein